MLTPPAPVVAISAAAFVAAFAVTMATVVWTTTLQEHIPPRALARVSAYDWLGSLVIMPIGFALAGPVSTLIGVDETLIGAAVLMVVSSVAVLAVPSVRALRRRDLTPPIDELLPRDEASPAEPTERDVEVLRDAV